MIIVSDTFSISNLLQIGSIELLKEIYGEITITPAVRRELYVLPDQAKNIDQFSWIIKRNKKVGNKTYSQYSANATN